MFPTQAGLCYMVFLCLYGVLTHRCGVLKYTCSYLFCVLIRPVYRAYKNTKEILITIWRSHTYMVFVFSDAVPIMRRTIIHVTVWPTFPKIVFATAIASSYREPIICLFWSILFFTSSNLEA